MNYEKKPSVTLEIPVPALADPKQVYYVRPVVTDGRGVTLWLPASQKAPPPAREIRCAPCNARCLGWGVRRGDMNRAGKTQVTVAPWHTVGDFISRGMI
jgi:hypothetical protein